MEDIESLCCSAPLIEETDLCSKCKEHTGASAVFTLSKEQVTEIYDCNFEPKTVIVGVNDSVHVRAHTVWSRFAKEMGFDVTTVEPIKGEPGVLQFSAEINN